MSVALNSPVLVLNRNWAPLRITSAGEALADLFVGKVEAIDTDYRCYDFTSWRELSAARAGFSPEGRSFVQAAREKILVPAVIRLLRYDRVKRSAVRLSRRNVFLRDGHRCQYCGGRFARLELNIDHVLPRCLGGGSTWENLVCSCVPCNTRKGGQTPAQAGMRLIRQPRRPEPFELAFRQTKTRHTSWQAFVDAAYWNVELVD